MNLGTEDEQTEFKRSTSELREAWSPSVPSSISMSLVSCILESRNDGEIIGQDVSEKTLRQVNQSVSNSIRPVIHPEVEQQYDEDALLYMRSILWAKKTSLLLQRPLSHSRC